MTKILSRCLHSMLLGMTILMSVIISSPQLITAQTIDEYTRERSLFQNNPQFFLGGHLEDMAVDPELDRVYVADSRLHRVHVISGNSHLDNIDFGTYPTNIAVDTKLSKVYVVNSIDNTVTIIDGVDVVPKQPYNITVGRYPTEIAVNSALHKVYVVNSIDNTVSVINAVTDKIENNTRVGTHPGPIAIDTNFKDLDKIYVGNLGNGTVSVIDGFDDTKELNDIRVGPIPNIPKAIAVNPKYHSVYVIHYSPSFNVGLPHNFIAVINPVTDKIESDIYVGGGASSMAIDPNRFNKVYVAHSYNDTVSVIDTSDNKKEPNNIRVGTAPRAMEFNKRGILYVMNARTVSAINGDNDKVLAGVIFNVSPENSANIKCNSYKNPYRYNNTYPTNTYLYVESGTKCYATPNKDFEFSGWVQNLGNNSTISLNTTAISDSLWNSFLGFLGRRLNDSSATFDIKRYGNFTANFKHAPPAVPAEYWIPLYGIILSSIVGWSIPNIIGWVKARRQGRRANQYYKRINRLYDDGRLDEDDIADLDRLKTDLTYVYAKGKISEQHYANLKGEISVLYEEIYKKKIDLLNGKG